MSLSVGIACDIMTKDPVLPHLKAESIQNFGSQAVSKSFTSV